MGVDILTNGTAAYNNTASISRISQDMKQETGNTEKTEKAEKTEKTEKTAGSRGAHNKSAASEKSINNSSESRYDADIDSKNQMEFLDKAIEEANKKVTGFERHFKYSIHEKTNEVMVKIIDTKTNEVVKELPPEKTLDAIAKMLELAGILVDEKR